MTKIVVDNSTPGGRQRQLEAQVQVAWANAASSVLNFLIGREADPIEAMKTLIAVHDAAEQESIDPEGIVIRGPAFGHTTNGHPDEIIDTVLTADLRKDPIRLRATLYGWIACFAQASEFSTFAFYLPVLFAAYVAAQEQIMRGFSIMEREIKKRRRRYRELERRLFDPD